MSRHDQHLFYAAQTEQMLGMAVPVPTKLKLPKEIKGKRVLSVALGGFHTAIIVQPHWAAEALQEDFLDDEEALNMEEVI